MNAYSLLGMGSHKVGYGHCNRKRRYREGTASTNEKEGKEKQVKIQKGSTRYQRGIKTIEVQHCPNLCRQNPYGVSVQTIPVTGCGLQSVNVRMSDCAALMCNTAGILEQPRNLLLLRSDIILLWQMVIYTCTVLYSCRNPQSNGAKFNFKNYLRRTETEKHETVCLKLQ